MNFPKKERGSRVLVTVAVWKRGRSVGRGLSESERVRFQNRVRVEEVEIDAEWTTKVKREGRRWGRGGRHWRWRRENGGGRTLTPTKTVGNRRETAGRGGFGGEAVGGPSMARILWFRFLICEI